MISAMAVAAVVTATGISLTGVQAGTVKDKLASLRKCIEICDV
jgi:hypothetical protein